MSEDPLYTVSAAQTLTYGSNVYDSLFRTNVDLHLDLYRPNTTPPTNGFPLIVLSHAGGFIGGAWDGDGMDTLCMEFAKRGFMAATYEYRMGWDLDFDGDIETKEHPNDTPPNTDECAGDPASGFYALYRATQDGHRALSYLVKKWMNAPNNYPIDTSLIYVGGKSAGAILAMHLAFATQAEFQSVWANTYLETPSLSSIEGPLKAGNARPYTIKGVMNGWGDITKPNFIDADETMAVVSFQSRNDQTNPFGHGHPKGCLQYGYADGSSTIHQLRINQGYCSQLFVDLDGVHGTAFLEGNEEALKSEQPRCSFIAHYASGFFRSVLCGTCVNFPCAGFDPESCAGCDKDHPDCAACSDCAPYEACHRSVMQSYFPVSCNDGVGQLRAMHAAPVAGWSLHPNPANAVLNVSAPATQGPSTLDIIDATGRVVRSMKMQAPAATIDLGGLRSGVYLLRATTGDQVRCEQRFVHVE